MDKSWSWVVVVAVGTAALAGTGGAAWAGAEGAGRTAQPSPPQEPIGFVAGGVVGGFAAGPFGAVLGAGVGTWLGNRVHRAGEAKRAEAQVAALRMEKARLEGEERELTAANRSLTVQVAQLTHSVETAQALQSDPARVLDGMQGDVLFRTGSAEIAKDTAHQIEVLAQAVAKSPALKVRVDGYADPRGTVAENLKLSEARANAVRDLLVAAGVSEQSLEVNAYGKSKSVADDDDGYALERRVRLTLQVPEAAAVTAEAAPADAPEPAGARAGSPGR